MNIQEIIDLDFLQKVQDSFAKATGLAAITVDFRGNPVTEYSNFSLFCKKIREDQQLYDKCLKCDAYGGLEAVRRENFFMYRCHTGLVDIAVPIIIKGQFIGSMLVGQVKLNETENNRLDYIIKESSNWKENKEIVADFDHIPIISIEKITAAAKMMFYVINNMVEKDVIQYVQEELRAKDQELINQLKIQADLERSLYAKQKQFFKLMVNPNLFFNVMNTMSCLAVLEKASRTQDVILTFSEMMKYLLTNDNTFVTVEDEISYIYMYVKLQKLRFEDRVQVMIDIPKELRSIKIPAMILQSILDNAFIHGIEPKDGKGSIQIKGYILDDDFICEVIDDGIGMTATAIASIMDKSGGTERESHSKGIGLHHVNFILTSNYGNEYKLKITQNDAGGTTVRFRVPK
ncbi:sensor histidine kinase [Schinkia azotoformans]|uniref:sensor histidine kinase n=1 Tax=Schinkia azotoformans TaxID=1454 RepID=UPI002DBD57D5|nr:PocR ligand-binding domain-containing protein [Schinkia azotoformans]MEC1772720.1 PocR ligand-binding domain-containing protein [Schinkia azotoformans]MED4368592.1 PocR ligand-binding domain-containing protein [Schinkia azotoformans]